MHDRSSHGEIYWRSALKRQAASGLSIARFCDQEGVSAPTFYKWRHRLQAAPRFTELCVGDPVYMPSPEIELADKIRIRISGPVDADQLTIVLSCLRPELC